MTLDITKKFALFCKESLDWCILQSDESATSIGEAIFNILENAERVSAMSKESIDSIKAVSEQVNGLIQDTKKKLHEEEQTELTESPVSYLISALKVLSDEHSELAQFFDPVITALQFQDRFRQNIENQENFINDWIQMRSAAINGEISNEHLSEFGNKLLSHCTMTEERNVVRNEIPGLRKKLNSLRLLMF